MKGEGVLFFKRKGSENWQGISKERGGGKSLSPPPGETPGDQKWGTTWDLTGGNIWKSISCVWEETDLREGSVLTQRQGPLGGSSMAAVQNKAFNFSSSDEQWPPPFLLRSHCPKDHDRHCGQHSGGSCAFRELGYSSRVTDPSVGGSETRLLSSQTWTYGRGKGLDLGLRVLPSTKAYLVQFILMASVS